MKSDPNEELKADEQDSIFLISTLTFSKPIIELPTRVYVNSLQQNNRNRRLLSLVVNDEDKEIDENKLTKLDSLTVNNNPDSDEELANKKKISIIQKEIIQF